MRSFSAVLPCRRSQVHLTSRAVNGLPSCHLTPSRSLKISRVPSSSHAQLLARSRLICVHSLDFADDYLSSQTSSKRQPLNKLLTMIVKPLTRGSQQLAARV